MSCSCCGLACLPVSSARDSLCLLSRPGKAWAAASAAVCSCRTPAWLALDPLSHLVLTPAPWQAPSCALQFSGLP